MNFKTVVPQPIRRRIASWLLPRRLVIEVYQRLHVDLAANPDQLLGNVVAPYAGRQYSFTLTEGPPPAYRHFFLFVVERREAEQFLIVLACSHTVDASGLN